MTTSADSTFDSFIAYLREELAYSPLTVTTYQRDLGHWRKFMCAEGQRLEVDDVKVNDLRAWVAAMSRKGLSTATIKQRLSAVRAFYRYRIRRGLASTNPASSVKINRRSKSLPKFIDRNEIANVLDTMDRDANVTGADFDTVRNDLVINIFYQTGMRSAEILALTDSRVDLVRNEFKVIGKRNKERIIPFGPNLRELILRYMALRDSLTSAPEAFITNDRGDALKYSHIHRIVRQALDGRVSSPKRSPHVLRHTFATDMLNNGAELTSVRDLLGHASLSATQVYTHVTPGELYENYKKAHPRSKK